MTNIIKKLIYQKKYEKYKELFDIDIDEICKIGANNFFYLIKISLLKNKKNYIEFKYLNFEIIISINNLNNLNEKIKILKILNQKIIYKILYKIELKYEYFNNDIYNFLKNYKYSIYIKSKYSKSDLFFINKNLSLFYNKEIYIGIDYLDKQHEINREIIYNIIIKITNNGGFINNDFIRLNSAYKKLYILGPKEVHLDLYEYCNASCNFCFSNGPGFLNNRNDFDNNYKIKYKLNDLLYFLNKISIQQTEIITFGINGEPFLNPNINIIIKELAKLNFKIGFLTNGYKLLNNINEIILNKKIKSFYINISSGNFQSFNNTRKNDYFYNFINVWKAIKIIKNKRHDIIIKALYIITPTNINGINKFIDLCISNNVDEIEYKKVVPYEFSYNDFYFSNKNINNIINLINENKDKTKNIRNNGDLITKQFKNLLEFGINNNEYKKISITTKCYTPYFYISIVRNSFYNCCLFEGKIGKLTNLDLYEQLLGINTIKNIIKSVSNIKEFLGEKKWMEKCIRCPHINTINMVNEFIKIKNLAEKYK